MASVEVAKLRLCCDPRQEGQARFAVEDALRTEIPDDGRLVLLRRMRIASAGSSAHPAHRQAAVREAWQAATGDARHGGEDGADDANCVWFASRAEAEAALLHRLLKGRAVDGWFWKLALAGWRGQTAPQWLDESLGECLGSGDDRRLLVIVETCIEAGAVAVLTTALEDVRTAMPAGQWGHGSSVIVPPQSVTDDDDAPHPDTPKIAAPVSVPAPMAVVVRRLIEIGSTRVPARAILRAFVLRRSPALTLSPRLFDKVVAATLAAITDGAIRQPPQRPEVSADALAATLSEDRHRQDAPQTPEARSPESHPQTDTQLQQERASHPSEAHADPGENPAQPETASPSIVPLRSEHAGLWLVVPSLCEMGLREWLAARPTLLADHPGRQLMLAIARHYRIAAHDPALAVLGEVDPSTPLPEWTMLWRHGLDGWLRRTARRRLHDLIRRPGRLDWDEQRLSVTFPPGAADIRLRRRALDRDPGWTDWLGLSIRFHFRDEVTG
jgi:hypothetical protein